MRKIKTTSLFSIFSALSILAVLFLSSCSNTNYLVENNRNLIGYGLEYPEDAPKVKSFDVFISRGSLNGTEFEHHIFSNDTLIQECGTIDRGRFRISEQNNNRVSTLLISDILANKTLDLSESIEESNSTWEKPGRSLSITDPGELKISFQIDDKKHSILTNLDSITLVKTNNEKYLNRFLRAIRGIKGKISRIKGDDSKEAELICGHQNFYGLGIVK